MENILVGCEYEELNKYTKSFNLASLDGYFWISIPKKINHYLLYEMYDLSNSKSREVNFYGKVTHDWEHPWIKMPLEILNMTSGRHTYKLIFMNTHNNDTATIFISYISQDDNPETPYVYMDDRGNPNHDDNAWKDGMYSDEYFDQLRKQIQRDYGYDPYQYYEDANMCIHCSKPNCDQCQYNQI